MEVEETRERVKKRRTACREGTIGGKHRRCHSAPSSLFKFTSDMQREIHVVDHHDDSDAKVVSECSVQLRIARDAAEAEEKRKYWEAEVEEFLSAAEQKQAQQFSTKYNYDVVNDAPLVGRYDWVPLTP